SDRSDAEDASADGGLARREQDNARDLGGFRWGDSAGRWRHGRLGGGSVVGFRFAAGQFADVAEVEGFAGLDLEFFADLDSAALFSGDDPVGSAGDEGVDREPALGIGGVVGMVGAVDVGDEIGIGVELTGSAGSR